MGTEMAQSSRKEIAVLVNWINENIRINGEANKHSRAPLTPIGVYNLRVADPESRNIFFVAACRTFGIPSRLNPETQIPEYNQNGEWIRCDFDNKAVAKPEIGLLKLTDKGNPVTPQYYMNYTIGFLKDGFYQSLEFPEGEKQTDQKKPIELEVGHYDLVTGTRLDDGSVLSEMTFFTIEKGKLTTLPIELRKQTGEIKPSGKLDLGVMNLKKEGNAVSLSSLTGGNYSVLVVLDPDKEPSKHILNDLGPYVDQFNQWGGQFVFAIPAGKEAQAVVMKTYPLPAKKEWGIDSNGSIINTISGIYGEGLKDKLPLVLFYDQTGNVFLFSSGYKIGMGEQLLKVISVVKANLKLKASCSK
jgi:hypothetical protein